MRRICNWTAALLLGLASSAFAAYDPFDDSFFHDWQLQFASSDWYAILDQNFESNPDDPAYEPATVTVDGRSFAEVGVRFKGNSSYNNPEYKKSLKLAFDEYLPEQRLDAMKTVNLNNGFKDPTFAREKIGLDFLARQGISLRSAYARVTVNGTYYGLLLAIEQINMDFLETLFGEQEDGNLYKGDPNGLLTYLGEDPDAYRASYEKKSNEEEDDWSDLIELTRLLEQTPDSTLLATLAPLLDLGTYLAQQAVHSVLVNLDAYFGTGHNYYLYRADRDGRFHTLPWDVNETFGNFAFQMTRDQLVELPPDWSQSPRPLFERLWESTASRSYFEARLRDVFAGDFHPDYLIPRLEALRDQLAPEVQLDPNYPFTYQQFLDGYTQELVQANFPVPGLIPFVMDRFSYLQGVLGPPPAGIPLLNELLADNATGLADEQGEREDWIELVNPGPGSLSTAGLFLSDDLTELAKWALPSRTLPAGGRLLLWADSDPAQGELHTNFQLSNDGEDLLLVAGDGVTVLQAVHFERQRPDVAWARQPEGGSGIGNQGLTWTFALPTPGATNAANAPPWIAVVEWSPEAPTDAAPVQFLATVSDAADATPEVWIDLVVNGAPQTLTLLDDGAHGDGASEDGVYGLAVGPLTGGTTVTFALRAGDSAGATSRSPADPAESYDFVVGSAGTTVPALVINEFLASNSTVLSDEAGEYDDWIEVHNAGTTAVNLGGLYLTDDLTNPFKWACPAVEIAAGGFLVFWADEDQEQGELHTSFKLSGGGEEIGLFLADGTEVDSVIFGAQSTDISQGRMPDGGESWIFFSTPTPGATNAPVIFEDGFESGDWSAWSTAVGG